ncbi:hypothetical protein AB0J86_20075 [Micromonospora sp. NPDC049559]|uniref:hypothetical protein n=1 Tax=Micromonospora sp. NPDC049559 TaxID=3155923 RepID=UPI003443F032
MGHEPLRFAAILSGATVPKEARATMLIEAYDDAEDPTEPYAVLVLSLRQAAELVRNLQQLLGAVLPVAERPESPASLIPAA